MVDLMKPKIALLHSETRSYRVPLFDLLSKNYDITFYFMYGAGWSAQYPESRNWKYKDLKRFPMIGYSSDFSPGIIFELFKNYDVIITSGLSSFATHISFLIAKLLRKKIILWDELWEWPRTFSARLCRGYAKFITKHSDACIAAGSKAREFYISFGAAPEKVFIANNCAIDMAAKPVRKDVVSSLKNKYGLHGKRVVLYLGRLIKYKGLDFLLKAFAKLEKKHDDLFLLIGGPDYGWEAECKRLAIRLGLKNYYFIGNVPHEIIQEHYVLGDVFVLPSRFLYEDNIVNESWGLTVNEALSLGIPVVSTTAVAAAYDMIKNGNSGFIVSEKNVSALAFAIEKTLDNQKVMTKKALKSFEEWNDYHKMFAGFKKAIDFAVAKHV